MTRSDEISDDIIEDLATLSNKLLAYNLICASEVVDDAIITVFGAMASDFLMLQTKEPNNLPIH